MKRLIKTLGFLIFAFIILAFTTNNDTSKPNQTTGSGWYSGGTLHMSTVGEWITASEKNKLATCADWVVTNTDRSGKQITIPDMKLQALALRDCIEKAISENQAEISQQPISEIVATCLLQIR